MKIKLNTKRNPMKLTQQHSTSHVEKVDLRRAILAELGVPEPRILDAFCAAGSMWKDAYGATPNYVGVDEKVFLDERTTVVADNQRFLRQIDLDQFDVFDLDAYGSPIECYAIICARLKWTRVRKVAFVMTDGTGLRAAMQRTPQGMLDWIGVPRPLGKTHLHFRDDWLVMALLKGADIAGATVGPVTVYSKYRARTEMRYLGFVMGQGIGSG